MDTFARTLETLFHAGNRCLEAGDAGGAETAFRAALALAPTVGELHGNLALALSARGEPIEAEAAYRRAIALTPDVQIRINFSALLLAQYRFAEAEALLQDSLSQHPDAPGLWSSYGVLLASLKREDEAERCYREALSRVPGHANAAFNLAYLLLRQGRYEEGWARLEARDWYHQLDRLLGLPRWAGEPLPGKSVLIGIEAGHGDMIQFCRYAACLKRAGAAHVSVLCHPALKRLLAGQAGIDEALAPGDPVPAGVCWDVWVPPLSLPFHFATRLDDIPAELPYLKPDPAAVATWAARFGPHDGGLRVGLAWKGNPRYENDRERSLDSLAVLAPLATVAGVRFVSLQKGAGEDEAGDPLAPLPFSWPGSQGADLADVAAVIDRLDLVISVDTAIAHLAGALGKPVWVLLPDFKPDWRWLADRSDSPWYPGVMRLFRQSPGGGWGSVVEAVRDALTARVGASAC